MTIVKDLTRVVRQVSEYARYSPARHCFRAYSQVRDETQFKVETMRVDLQIGFSGSVLIGYDSRWRLLGLRFEFGSQSTHVKKDKRGTKVKRDFRPTFFFEIWVVAWCKWDLNLIEKGRSGFMVK